MSSLVHHLSLAKDDNTPVDRHLYIRAHDAHNTSLGEKVDDDEQRAHCDHARQHQRVFRLFPANHVQQSVHHWEARPDLRVECEQG